VSYVVLLVDIIRLGSSCGWVLNGMRFAKLDSKLPIVGGSDIVSRDIVNDHMDLRKCL
jgi:hypothetical protein